MSRTTTTVGPHRAVPAGPIHADTLYPIEQGKGLLGWGSRNLASAKQRGLKVLCFGKRSYLLGADIIAFLQEQPAIERHGGPGRPDLIRSRLSVGEDR